MAVFLRYASDCGVTGYCQGGIGWKSAWYIMLLEVGIVLLTDIAILRQPISLEFTSVEPSSMFSGNMGIAMVFAICSFVGFEATAIYSEECREPEK